MASDWLLGTPRDKTARDRLLTVAATLLGEHGVDGFDVSELARRAHCSRATVYRHVGGREPIIEAVLARSSVRIVHSVMARVEGLEGAERARVALESALESVRGDRIAAKFFASGDNAARSGALLDAPIVVDTAAGLIGLEDPDGERARLAARVFLSLLWWPPARGEQAQIDLLVDALRL